MVGLYDDEEVCPECDSDGEAYYFGDDCAVKATCLSCNGSGMRTRPERDEDERRDR